MALAMAQANQRRQMEQAKKRREKEAAAAAEAKRKAAERAAAEAAKTPEQKAKEAAERAAAAEEEKRKAAELQAVFDYFESPEAYAAAAAGLRKLAMARKADPSGVSWCCKGMKPTFWLELVDGSGVGGGADALHGGWLVTTVDRPGTLFDEHMMAVGAEPYEKAGEGSVGDNRYRRKFALIGTGPERTNFLNRSVPPDQKSFLLPVDGNWLVGDVEQWFKKLPAKLDKWLKKEGLQLTHLRDNEHAVSITKDSARKTYKETYKVNIDLRALKAATPARTPALRLYKLTGGELVKKGEFALPLALA